MFILDTPDETVQSLMRDIADALAASQPKLAELKQEILADHIRNQHRKARDMECHIARWNRNAPELRVVTVVEEGRVAA